MNELIISLFNLAKTKDKVARCRVVAAIIKRNKIYSVGFNSYKTSRLSKKFKKNDFSLYNHAEVSAIHKFLKNYPKRDISRYTIVVVRIKLIEERWVLGCSKPCRGCQKLIQYFQLKRVIFYRKNKWVIQ